MLLIEVGIKKDPLWVISIVSIFSCKGMAAGEAASGMLVCDGVAIDISGLGLARWPRVVPK